MKATRKHHPIRGTGDKITSDFELSVHLMLNDASQNEVWNCLNVTRRLCLFKTKYTTTLICNSAVSTRAEGTANGVVIILLDSPSPICQDYRVQLPEKY